MSDFHDTELQEFYDDVGEYDNVRRIEPNADDILEDYNDTNVVFTNPKRVTNALLVRFSKNPSTGPLLGHDGYRNLGLTMGPMGNRHADDPEGLAFAFPQAYAKQHRDNLSSKYGRYTRVIRVPEALLVEHMGDNELQAIFRVSDAKKVEAISFLKDVQNRYQIKARYDWERDEDLPRPEEREPNAGYYQDDRNNPWIGFPKSYQPPKPIASNEIWWHGRSSSDSGFGNRIAFFTDDKKEAKFYAMWIFHNEKGLLIKAKLKPKKVANAKDLADAAISVGATRTDIKTHYECHESDNDNDFAYVPAVRKELLKRGYDVILTWDAMSNYEIRCAIVINPRCIHVIGSEEWSRE
jgi:hypothetical protein